MNSTSVRVALRVRPFNDKEILQNCNECLTKIPDAPQILIETDKSFTFDYVFPSDTKQEEVFQECASPLVEKLVKGNNATILAYGQTGSGKTYSMGTSSNIPQHQGIIPRAIKELFIILHEQKEKNPSYQFEVYVSFLELYNEVFKDLLYPRSRENNKKGKNDLMIREDANGQICLSGVKEVQVSTPDELLGHLQKGLLRRTVASTDMNMVSSRSHAIFTVILKQTGIENLEENNENNNPPAESSADSKRMIKQKSLTSKFHFVDLAGSERLKKTNAVGDRVKEGIAINESLLALGNVISALGDESRNVTHIPYRDSKLTRLLQDSLGGNSQTLMLACVSPADSNFMETLNTLKYANRARNIKNKVNVNESYDGNSVEINQLRAQIRRLKIEIQTLRAGGCNEKTSRRYEEEIESLKGELGLTKTKLQNVEQELISVNAEKNTLLMEISFNQDLSDADREHRTNTHRIVQGYETEIKNLNNEPLTAQYSRKSSLVGTTPVREKGHVKSSNPHNFLSDEDIHHQNNESFSNKENGEKKGKKKKKRSSKKSKIRVNDYFSVSDEISTGEDENLKDEFSTITRRSKAREKFEKPNEQLRQSYMIIKNGSPSHDDSILGQQPSSTKNESYIDQVIPNHLKGKRRSSSVYFSEIQPIEVPVWQESREKRSSSVSSIEIPAVEESSSSDEPISPHSAKSNSSHSSRISIIAFTRVLREIRSYITIIEQLISQLELFEQKYTNMRDQYEQMLADMQEDLQKERDAAAQHASTGRRIAWR